MMFWCSMNLFSIIVLLNLSMVMISVVLKYIVELRYMLNSISLVIVVIDRVFSVRM